MDQQSYNSLYGDKKLKKKAFVFTLDAAMAVIVVVTLLLVAHYYVNRTNTESLSKIGMVRTGSDILTVLDNDGTLSTLDENSIATEMNNLLPVNYNMRIMLYCTNQTLGISTSLPSRKFVASGKRIIVADDDFCTARYWIWLR